MNDNPGIISEDWRRFMACLDHVCHESESVRRWPSAVRFNGVITEIAPIGPVHWPVPVHKGKFS